jgi:FlaG/FlaF family flagellin (archaellin)
MKGVSAVIAIILILMIVVALAALAYTWFTGIFTSLTGTTETAVTQTTQQMTQSFVVEIAYCDTTINQLQFTIRNTGSNDITASGVAAYVGGTRLDPLTAPGSDIAPGEVGDYSFDYACGVDVGSPLTVTIGSGLSKTKTIV